MTDSYLTTIRTPDNEVMTVDTDKFKYMVELIYFTRSATNRQFNYIGSIVSLSLIAGAMTDTEGDIADKAAEVLTGWLSDDDGLRNNIRERSLISIIGTALKRNDIDMNRNATLADAVRMAVRKLPDGIYVKEDDNGRQNR